jgi:hypothetical protein
VKHTIKINYQNPKTTCYIISPYAFLRKGSQKAHTVFRVPLTKLNLKSGERNLERSLRMQSSNSTVFPLPVGAEITMFTSEKKHTWKHSLCKELKYLHRNRNVTKLPLLHQSVKTIFPKVSTIKLLPL